MAREIRPKDYPKLKNYQPTRFMLPTSRYDKKKADRAIMEEYRIADVLDYQNAKKTSKKKAMDYLTKKAGNYCFFRVKNGKILRMYYGLEQFVG